ncbi:MAG: GIY-YIG nuclease family protein [Chloroflexi bacterium]|nr:GIY-YIG nuclease family protein [Chloroflexota bacterium]
MKQNKTFCVYILANRSGSTYVGMTSDLYGRMIKHREGLIPGYTLDRNIKRLVYFEAIENAHAAVARERQIKKWRRSRKIALVESVNPTWEDLFPAFRAGMSLRMRSARVDDRGRRSKLANALTSVAEPPSSG